MMPFEIPFSILAPPENRCRWLLRKINQHTGLSRSARTSLMNVSAWRLVERLGMGADIITPKWQKQHDMGKFQLMYNGNLVVN